MSLAPGALTSMSGRKRSKGGRNREANSPLAWCGWLWALGELMDCQLGINGAGWLGTHMPSPQASLLRWPGGGRAFTNRSLCAWHVNIPRPRLQGQFNKILEASVEHLLRPGPRMGSAELIASGQDTASLCLVGVQPGGCRPQQSWHRIRGTPSSEVGGAPQDPLCVT